MSTHSQLTCPIVALLALLMTSPAYAAPPSVPANLFAASPLVGTADVTWNDTTNETDYELHWGPSALTMVVPLPANTTSFTFDSLNPGTSYHFRIDACNPDGCAESVVVGRTPDGSTGLPGVPLNLAAASTHAGTDVVTWDDLTNETSYELGWGPSNTSISIEVGANTLHHIFSMLDPGVSYHFRVRGCNSAGCGDFTEVVGQTPDGTNQCWLAQQSWFAGGRATISYVLAAKVPSTWRLWAVGSFGFVQLLSVSLPDFPPVATGDITFSFPSVGIVGFLAGHLTPTGGLICSDLDTVNTTP